MTTRPGVVAARLAEAVVRPASGAHLIAAARHSLRPGAFVNVGGAVWHHWRETVPAHLRRSKGGGHEPRPLQWLARLAPRYVWIAQHDGPEQFPIAVAAADGDLLLIDPAAGRVVRRRASATPRAIGDSDQSDDRDRWQRHVAAALPVVPRRNPGDESPVEPRRDSTDETEQYVVGRHMADLSIDAQVTACRAVFAGYARLVAAESSGEWGRGAARVREIRDSGRLPPAFARRLPTTAVIDAAARWPVVPSGSDNSPHNVVVADDGTPVFVDCLPMRRRVFFAHPVGIVTGWLLPGVRRAYLTGAMDTALAQLVAHAGLASAADAVGREAWLAMSVLAAALETGASAALASADACELVTAYGLDREDAWRTA